MTEPFSDTDWRWVRSRLALSIGCLAWYDEIHHVEFAALLVAVAVTAWYGSIGPAMVALLFSSLGYAYFFAPPVYSFAVSGLGDSVITPLGAEIATRIQNFIRGVNSPDKIRVARKNNCSAPVHA